VTELADNKAFAAWRAFERETAEAQYGAAPEMPEDPGQPPTKPVEHRGQLRMAERFASEHALALRHVHDLGWHTWDGCRWLRDDMRVEVRSVKATIQRALQDAVAVADKEQRNALFKELRRMESASAMEGIARIAAALHPISTSPKWLDADPYVFNTAAGTLDLHTGETRKHGRTDLITKVAGGALNGDRCHEWHTFLERILPDEQIRAFVQRLVGYCMSGKVTEHIMPIFTGTGANGKGTLRDALLAAFGDYAIEVDPALLMESKHERHGAFKMRLRGARLVFCSETEKERRFSESTMKRLTGGDPIEANLMHRNPITFDPSHALIMMTNHLPRVSGDDPAVWRRILVVPFDVVIPEEERDGSLPERLKLAASEVIAWAHQGWLAYCKEGLNPPEAVRARTAAYQAASDALGRFLEERTVKNPTAAGRSRVLFEAWKSWCLHNGEEPGTENAFAESMAAREFTKKRTSAGYVYPGLMLAGGDTGETL
jgi:putative DNA primase/helicase